MATTTPSSKKVSDVKLVEYRIGVTLGLGVDEQNYRRDQAEKALKKLLSSGYEVVSSTAGVHSEGGTVVVYLLVK